MPIFVGGSGETLTLRLAAKYAAGCNLFGDARSVARKMAVLQQHCESIGREMSDIEVTHLSNLVLGRDRDDLDTRIGIL